MILIKPHHFMDIIKLYGSGIEVFVPAPDFGHDFYRAANRIVGNPETELKLTVHADDICGPCRFLEKGLCADRIGHIEGITSKDQYNKLLDGRILEALGMEEGERCTAGELCSRMAACDGLVERVWVEENTGTRERRAALFGAGTLKYLEVFSNTL